MNKLFLLLCFLPILAFSQLANIDSLEQVVENNDFENETEKIKVINTLASAYMKSKPKPRYDDAIALSLREEKTFTFEASNHILALFYGKLATSFSYQNTYSNKLDSKENAVFYYEKAIPYAEADKDSSLLASIIMGAADIILYDEPTKAFSYYQKATKIYELNKRYKDLMSCYTGLCTSLSVMGRMDEALVYSRKALDIMPKIDDANYVVYTCLSIGLLYSNAGKHEYSEDLFQQAYDVSIKAKQDDFIFNSLIYLAGNTVKKEKPSTKELAKAKTQLDECLVFFTKVNDENLLQHLNSYYVYYYRHLKDYKKALESSNTYMKYMLKIGDKERTGIAYSLHGSVHKENNQPDSAIVYFEKVVELAKESSNDILLTEAYLSLYETAKEQKNFEQALVYHENYSMHHDTIYNQKLQKIIGTEGVRLDIAGEKKARKTAEFEAQLLSSRNQLYGAIALGLLAILLIGGYLFRQLQKTRKQLENQNLQLSQLNATKDKFFGIIAHDIRSPITALDSVGEQMTYYLSTNNTKKLQRLGNRIDVTAKRLSSLLDNLLNWALLQTGMIPYHPNSLNLKETADEVLALYTPLAETKKINLVNNISAELAVFADGSALNTIIRNLINNALKFTNENGEVSISSYEESNQVFIEINDTGTGIHAEKLEQLFALERKSTQGTAGEKGSGLGLMLCKELVELHKGTIKAVSELGKGSTFIFSIPVTK